VDSLCADAVDEIDRVPTSGDDAEDFAIEEYAISEILRDLADEVASAGAGDLSAALDEYAQARADLAVAYDSEMIDQVNAASANVDQAAQGVASAAYSVGAPTCEELVR
jgi:hypothetical protein